MSEKRNDVTSIVSIPVTVAEYTCGCWGKHLPPYITGGEIVLPCGLGYRSRNHTHGQNFYVLDVQDNMALVEFRKYGDLYGAGVWRYLTGEDDGHLFVCHVSKASGSVADTLKGMVPIAVKRAMREGLDVRRQGDWFFVPVARSPRGKIEYDCPLDDDHRASEIVALKTVVYVRGSISHSQHKTIRLDGWHKAIRNGRLALLGGDD